jgi:hypothetical protein
MNPIEEKKKQFFLCKPKKETQTCQESKKI